MFVGVINRSEWPRIPADIIADTRFGGGRILVGVGGGRGLPVGVGVGDFFVVSTGRQPKEFCKDSDEDG